MFFQKQKDTKNTSTAVFTIEGMHCTSCAMNIDGSLEDTEGVLSATTNYAKSVTKVEYDAQKVQASQLLQVIEETGYRASLETEAENL